LNRENRLRCKCLEKIYNLGGETSHLPAIDRQATHNAIFAKQRNGKKRPIAEPSCDGPNSRAPNFPFFQQVNDLDWRLRGSCTSSGTVTQTYRIGAKHLDEFVLHAVAGAQVKFLCCVVVFIDRPGIGSAQLHSMRDNARQHRFEVQIRAHCPSNLVQRTKLIQSPAKFPRPNLYFLFQVGVRFLQLRSHAVELVR
jgi:hypothetical protein